MRAYQHTSVVRVHAQQKNMPIKMHATSCYHSKLQIIATVQTNQPLPFGFARDSGHCEDAANMASLEWSLKTAAQSPWRLQGRGVPEVINRPPPATAVEGVAAKGNVKSVWQKVGINWQHVVRYVYIYIHTCMHTEIQPQVYHLLDTPKLFLKRWAPHLSTPPVIPAECRMGEDSRSLS